ncbi:MAG: GWxTD domain-containing protein, partial [Ignavibacteria bacterium]|nr:GWxTD domain-containing protein [Ignavibacteria bacterium]
AVGWKEGRQGVWMLLAVSNRSRVFLQEKEGLRSFAEVSAWTIDRATGAQAAEHAWAETTHAATYQESRSTELVLRRYFMEVPDGNYDLVVSLRDGSTGKRLARRQQIEVEANRFFVASALVMSKRGSGPLTTLFGNRVAEGVDSVTLSILLNTPREGRHCHARVWLTRYPHDTAAAVPPHYFTAPLVSRGYIGVDYTLPDTVLSDAASETTVGRQTTLRLQFGTLTRGFYRAHVTVQIRREKNSPRARTITLVRDIAVFSPSYPRVETPADFIGPVAYIGATKEIDDLREASSSGAMMERLRTFWLTPGRDQTEAGQSMNEFYSRVEEANRLFSNHKEGWRTDQGMIYIVHGAPVFVGRDGVDSEIWQYPDRGLTYAFVRATQAYDHRSLLENYVLIRRGSIVAPQEWLEAIKTWRGGTIPFGVQ